MSPRIEKLETTGSGFVDRAKAGLVIKLAVRAKAETKRKFDVYPSAYANAYLVRTYKKRGGKYRTA